MEIMENVLDPNSQMNFTQSYCGCKKMLQSKRKKTYFT